MILKIYLLIFYPTVDCLYVWSQQWSFLPLVRNLPDQPIILKCALFNQVSLTCFQILFKTMDTTKVLTSLTEHWSEGILSMDGLLWPMVSFLSFRQSTEPVLVSYVSRQDSGSSLLPESVSDSSSDPCHLLQWSLNEFICWPFFFRFDIPFVILW